MTKDDILKMEPGLQLNFLVRKSLGLKNQGNLPYYSTQIKAAWGIVEKLKEKGFWCEIKTPFYPLNPDSKYYVGFTPWNVTGFNGRPDNQASGNSVPEAISKAALLALLE